MWLWIIHASFPDASVPNSFFSSLSLSLHLRGAVFAINGGPRRLMRDFDSVTLTRWRWLGGHWGIFFFLEHREPSLKGEKGTRLLSNFTRPTGPVSNSLTRSQHPLEAKLRQQHQVQEPKQQPCHENSKTFFWKKETDRAGSRFLIFIDLE